MKIRICPAACVFRFKLWTAVFSFVIHFWVHYREISWVTFFLSEICSLYRRKLKPELVSIIRNLTEIELKVASRFCYLWPVKRWLVQCTKPRQPVLNENESIFLSRVEGPMSRVEGRGSRVRLRLRLQEIWPLIPNSLSKTFITC